ncbi:hypothetical protein OROHE_010655 [Orobanche hederae]
MSLPNGKPANSAVSLSNGKPANGAVSPSNGKPANGTVSLSNGKPANGAVSLSNGKPANGGADPPQVKPANGADPAQVKPANDLDPAQVKPANDLDPAQVKPANDVDSAQVKLADPEPTHVRPADPEPTLVSPVEPEPTPVRLENDQTPPSSTDENKDLKIYFDIATRLSGWFITLKVFRSREDLMTWVQNVARSQDLWVWPHCKPRLQPYWNDIKKTKTYQKFENNKFYQKMKDIKDKATPPTPEVPFVEEELKKAMKIVKDDMDAKLIKVEKSFSGKVMEIQKEMKEGFDKVMEAIQQAPRPPTRE